jgi:hypothetical protein
MQRIRKFNGLLTLTRVLASGVLVEAVRREYPIWDLAISSRTGIPGRSPILGVCLRPGDRLTGGSCALR